MAEEIDVVIQPVGRTPAVLEPALAKYKPQVIVIITSKDEFANIARENIEKAWIKHTRRMPDIIVKILTEPWTADTVDRYMVVFDEAVEEINKQYKHRDKNWHVGTAGGTNLMGIGSALSAFTHRFPVYYSTEKEKNPGVSIDDLCLEIPFFELLGPGFKALQRTRCMKIMKIIDTKGPVQPSEIAFQLKTTKQNESAGRKPLVDSGLIIKTEFGWVPSNVGKSLLALMDYEEE